MDTGNIIALLSLAFGLGIVHALDADHIMAVSGLASARPNQRNNMQNCVRFCLRWAIGHGSTLLMIGGMVFLLGLAIPHTLSRYAENSVAFLLIIIGLWILWDIIRKKVHLHFHKHDGLPEHAHWHHHPHANSEKLHNANSHKHQHSAVIVGVLHGAAGSAPLLVLIPMAQLNSAWLALAYLLLFSLGVLLAMLFFGGMLGRVYNTLSRWGDRVVRITQMIIATSAVSFGTFLLVGNW